MRNPTPFARWRLIKTLFTLGMVILCFASLPLSAQLGNCFNAGFETGTLGGYLSYYGEIKDNGTVIINTSGIDPDQHKIMTKEDGFDPIAHVYCDENEMLEVVPQGVGRYSFRLGNEEGGAKAARIVLEFEVTDDVTFFLLKYAVLLEDPDHEHFEQPRFALNIRDEFGAILNCGEYKVRAAETIPGFETCRELWRVRPWTTAGFELQSYLGQKIQIEILTTDCSRGGHGGYAYIDASCKPLELILDGYCQESTTATYIATAGFDAYLWNTGDTTNSITFSNPVAGTVYQVTVTSSTGCTLVLTDTLPVIKDLPPPLFDPLRDTLICKGDGFWIKPTGDNLPYVYSVELDYPADSFFVSPPVTTTYAFYTKDKYGCKSDTASMTVTVVDLDFEIIADKPCGNIGTGGIAIHPVSGSEPYEYFVNGTSAGGVNSYPALALGSYAFGLRDGHGCMVSKDYLLNGHPVPKIQVAHANPAVCGRQNGSIVVVPNGIPSAFKYHLDDGAVQSSPDFAGLDSGMYIVHLINEFGCRDSATVFVDAFDPPRIVSLTTDSATCNLPTGRVHVSATGGFGVLSFALNSVIFQSGTTFDNLAPGMYTIYIRDEAGCTINQKVQVYSISFPEIVEVSPSPTTCGLNNGTVLVTTHGGTPPLTYRVNSEINSNGRFESLPPGPHRVSVTDKLGCIDSEPFFVGMIDPPVMSGIQFIEQGCDSEFAIAEIDIRNGVPPYSYSKDGGLHWSANHLLQSLPFGEHHISAIDQTGCVLDTILIIPRNHIYIPNAFSPNGDGVNDFFTVFIEGAMQTKVMRFEIYDRWGQTVHAYRDITPDVDSPQWDGKTAGRDLPQGVYVYSLLVTMADGRKICRSGDVTLVR